MLAASAVESLPKCSGLAVAVAGEGGARSGIGAGECDGVGEIAREVGLEYEALMTDVDVAAWVRLS